MHSTGIVAGENNRMLLLFGKPCSMRQQEHCGGIAVVFPLDRLSIDISIYPYASAVVRCIVVVVVAVNVEKWRDSFREKGGGWFRFCCCCYSLMRRPSWFSGTGSGVVVVAAAAVLIIIKCWLTRRRSSLA